jgi:O-succinylbenzoic acid--CoA ligase
MRPWLETAARLRPDRIAIEGPGRALTYRELLDAACSCERPASGSLIPIAEPDPVEFVIALHACLLAGAAAVPIDLRLSEREQAARLGAGAANAGAGAVDAGAGAVDARAGAVDTRTAVVMHTSGTTSAPRPVALSHGNFLASALGSAGLLGLDLGERWLCPMPLTHVGGLSIPIRSAIYATTAVVHGRFDTGSVLEELMNRERRITLVSLVPTMLSRLLDAGLEQPPTLRWALLGGGPIPLQLLERAQQAGVPVAPTYGMTEACSQIATFGVPLPGVELRIVDDEVHVRGPIVAPEAASGDGWLHTGDLGAFDDRGLLVISGRRGDTIITGGENVSPVEVEEVLLTHPQVADAAVIGRPDPEWGEALVAFVVGRDGGAVEPDELRAHCRNHLAPFKVPKRVEFVPELPRTPSGKLLRGQLG